MQNKTLAYCSLSRFFVGRNSAITKTSCRINHHKNRNKITYNKNKDKNKNINNKIKNKTQQSSVLPASKATTRSERQQHQQQYLCEPLLPQQL